MIVPNGKRRSQVNQGGLKHESIWDSSFFTGVAGDLVKEALAPVSPPGGEAGKTDTPEAQAMGDSNSARLNPKHIPSPGEMKGKPGMPPETTSDALTQTEAIGDGPQTMQMSDAQQRGWKFDPQTGQPLLGVNGTKLMVLMEKWLASQQETADLSIMGFSEKGGQYQLTLGPKGKAVSKGGV